MGHRGFLTGHRGTWAGHGSEGLKWGEVPQIMALGSLKVVVIYENILAGGSEKELDEFWQGLP